MALALKLQRTCVFLYLGAIVLQFYAAGLAVFGVSSFMTHALFGYSMILGAIILLVLTFVAKLAGRVKILAVLVLILTVLQPVLALIRRPIYTLSALHPVNGLLIFAIATRIAVSTDTSAGARPAVNGRGDR